MGEISAGQPVNKIVTGQFTVNNGNYSFRTDEKGHVFVKKGTSQKEEEFGQIVREEDKILYSKHNDANSPSMPIGYIEEKNNEGIVKFKKLPPLIPHDREMGRVMPDGKVKDTAIPGYSTDIGKVKGDDVKRLELREKIGALLILFNKDKF